MSEARDQGWRVSDALWERIERLLPPWRVHRFGGHDPRVGDRDALDGIFFVLRGGNPWSALNQTVICGKSSAYRRFREWAAGFFQQLWEALLNDPVLTLDWDWLALDGQIVNLVSPRVVYEPGVCESVWVGCCGSCEA